jgi:hypothetical protein
VSNTLAEQGRRARYAKLRFRREAADPTIQPDFSETKEELHDRDAQFAEKDVREAVQSARWMREITEQYAGDWEQTYEDALAESKLTEEDETYL